MYNVRHGPRRRRDGSGTAAWRTRRDGDGRAAATGRHAVNRRLPLSPVATGARAIDGRLHHHPDRATAANSR
jgi:hypothetical protein